MGAGSGAGMDRRSIFRMAAAGVAAGVFAQDARGAPAGLLAAPDQAFAVLRDRRVSIGMLIFERMDQIDFTGPFEVLARVPDSAIAVFSPDGAPVRDFVGLTLTPDMATADLPEVDLLVITGGPGQEDLMADEALLSLIRDHVAAGKPLLSVCTGALICGAAGVLIGRRATTHWASVELLPYFGAIPEDARVVIDGGIVTTAGVTAGLDGALMVAALLRGEAAAQTIQLAIEYAPEPGFAAGSPETAPADVLANLETRLAPQKEQRLETARAVARRLGIPEPR